MELLRTPEEVAEDLGANVSPHMVRRLIRDGKVEYTKLSRGKFAMTQAQVDGMLRFLAQAPVADTKRSARGESVFKSGKK
jgi:predicted site-specific integrase-resolvase